MCQPKGSSAYGTCGNKVTFFSLKSSFGKWENQSFLEDQSLHSVWKNVSPPNVEVSVWMALQESIVFESILVRRGILSNKQDICSLCNSEIETPNHVLPLCLITWEIWSEVMQWWDCS